MWFHRDCRADDWLLFVVSPSFIYLFHNNHQKYPPPPPGSSPLMLSSPADWEPFCLSRPRVRHRPHVQQEGRGLKTAPPAFPYSSPSLNLLHEAWSLLCALLLWRSLWCPWPKRASSGRLRRQIEPLPRSCSRFQRRQSILQPSRRY